MSCGSQRYFFLLLDPIFCFYAGLVRTFFSSQTRIALSFRHYVNLFPFFPGLARFSALGPNFLLLYGSGSHFFSSQTRGALLFWHYVNLFSILYGSGTRFFLLWNFAFSFYQPRIPICLTILHTFFQHCFIPFSHLSGILIIVKRKSPLTQFLFHNMAGKYPTSYRLLLLFIK